MNPNEQQPEQPQQQPPQPAPAAPTTAPAPQTPPDVAQYKETASSFSAQDPVDEPLQGEAPDEHIEWQASEYMHHEKNFMWFLIFFVCTAAVVAIMYLILRDILSVIVIALMSIALAVFANRPPRTLSYAVNQNGLTIGEKKYSFDSFRSFSVMDEGSMESIVVDPIQKFMPPITIYCDPQDMERIVDVLTYYLPHEDKAPDWVDRFAKRIRF